MSTRQHPETPGRRPENSNPNTPNPTRNPEWAERWQDVRTNLRQQHQGLTDADLNYTKGNEKDLYHRVGTRLGKTEQEAQELVERAAKNQSQNPQDRSTLKDQRDRTTGADQATRKDAPSAKEPTRATNTQQAERTTDATDARHDTDNRRK